MECDRGTGNDEHDVMDALQGRPPDQELRWMIQLGANLTVSARGYYPLKKKHGSLSHLMGFNELQHQVYGRIRQFGCDQSWTLDTFVEGLLEKAESPVTSVGRLSPRLRQEMRYSLASSAPEFVTSEVAVTRSQSLISSDDLAPAEHPALRQGCRRRRTGDLRVVIRDLRSRQCAALNSLKV